MFFILTMIMIKSIELRKIYQCISSFHRSTFSLQDISRESLPRFSLCAFCKSRQNQSLMCFLNIQMFETITLIKILEQLRFIAYYDYYESIDYILKQQHFRFTFESFAKMILTIFLQLCNNNCFSNIFGILLPSMRVPGLDACKPIPFRRVFCFLSHSDFLLQDLFSSTIFFFSSTTIHSRMQAKNRMF